MEDLLLISGGDLFEGEVFSVWPTQIHCGSNGIQTVVVYVSYALYKAADSISFGILSAVILVHYLHGSVMIPDVRLGIIL